MLALVIQHVAAESAVSIADALHAAGAEIDVRRTDRGDTVPEDPRGYAGVVVMGGPMSATSDARFPSRQAELTLLRGALATGLPTLGVCLGAQLLAAAAGGEVVPGDGAAQVGWGPVRLTAAAAADPLLHGLPAELPVLHWHGETYRPPPTAVGLAGDARYANQATRFGARGWGLQFHVEVDEAAVARFAAAFAADAAHAGGPAVLAADSRRLLPALRPHRDQLLGRFARLVTAPEHAGPVMSDPPDSTDPVR